MAQDIYTKITDLQPVENADLKANDMFMISRPSGSGYISYSCGYNQLSSAFVSSIVDALSVSGVNISAQGIVTDKNALQQFGHRLVAENVIWKVSQEAATGASQTGALLKNSGYEQVVEGPVIFNRLSCGNNAIASPKDVVNYLALSNYVATAGMMPFFQGCAASNSTTVIHPDQTNDLNGILHKISADCIAQVILYSTKDYDDFCIFAYCMTCHAGELDQIYNDAKEEVEQNDLEPDNYCVLQHVQLKAKKPVIINLPMRKKNILCFFPVGKYNAETGLFEPVAGNKIKKKQLTITVREYKSFVED